MKIFEFLLVMILVLPACKSAGSGAAQSDSNSQLSTSDSTLCYTLVSRYVESINEADTILGERLWSHVDEVSFINPMGHEHGWSGIKNIYNMFRDNFSERKLSFYNLKSSVYNDFVWLEFYWVFDGVTKPDNSKIQTKGRETQIWRKINNEWRLIHIHYSDMPVAR